MEQAANILRCTPQRDLISRTGIQLSKTQKLMLDATPDCIKLLNIDGILLTMNKAGRTALNLPEDTSFGMEWLSLLPADLRSDGTKALYQAASGENARFSGRSEGAASPIYWDNLLTPITGTDGRVKAILCVSRDITEKVELERALEEAINRERLLAGEMQHRIKNLFSMTSALSQISEREAAQSTSNRSATEILREKLYALARASNAMFATPHGSAEKSTTICLLDLIQSILAPYGDRCRIDGAPLPIPRDMGTNLALFLHEHATNAIKYGALSTDDGLVAINWTQNDRAIQLEWSEKNGPPISGPPSHQGFGSKMIDRIVASAGGSVERRWPTEGLIATLQIPVK